MITVFGYGSLLSEASARETLASLRNFRIVSVHGYKRIFNKVGIAFFRMGLITDAVHLASCATRADDNHAIACSAFECPEEDFPMLYEREHRFRWVLAQGSVGGLTTTGRMCTEYADDDYRLNKCVTEARYHQLVGQHYSGRIWRDDILPQQTYLAHCLMAAKSQGEQVHANFLDSSFLADGRTTIRTYLDQYPDALDDRSYSYSPRQ